MRLALFLLVWTVTSGAALAQGAAPAGALTWQAVAPGLEFAAFEAAAVTGEPGPVAVHALRLDLARVRLELALAGDTSPALERVDAMAARHGALAAVNAGFFLPRGRPAGLLKFDGRLVAPGADARAAVGTLPGGTIAIDCVRPTMTTLLAWGGVWPAPWFETGHGTSPVAWLAADDAIGGAGLIVKDGRDVEDWAGERVTADFRTTRHPRTVAGLDGSGRVWLLAIDGRRPGHSLGASFAALARLARHLGLVDVVNLDGGGSTTMVVRGRIVNRPSDLRGPRPVSDALVVLPRVAR
jgi:hypothetical protein